MKRQPGFHFLSAAVFALALLCAAQAAQSYVLQTYNGNTVKWNVGTLDYYVNTSGGPAYSLTSIQTAMNSWNGVSTSYLRFVNKGSTANSGINNGDGVNTISFGEPGAGYLGVAWFRYNSSGLMLDCDIILRNNYAWSDTYLADVAAHELGHCVPLNHTSDPNTTMYPTVRQGARVLSQDDISGISYLYPANPSGIPAMDNTGAAVFAVLSAAALAFYFRRMRGRGRGGDTAG
jgi:hypothetical protein